MSLVGKGMNMADEESQYKPDTASHPGETLLETIQMLGISPSELADKTGIHQEDIELVISGNLRISHRMARKLAKVLGIPVSFWLKRQSNYDDFLEREAFGGHKDVWIEVDGHQQRVLGDPNMSGETKKALAKMIKAATEAVERGDFDNDEGDKLRVCKVCKQYECVAPATKCWRCREQEMIDSL